MSSGVRDLGKSVNLCVRALRANEINCITVAEIARFLKTDPELVEQAVKEGALPKYALTDVGQRPAFIETTMKFSPLIRID